MKLFATLLFAPALAAMGVVATPNAIDTGSSSPIVADLDDAVEALPMSITGNCKDVELVFSNRTNGKITVPQKGHRMRNRGSVEGWNKLTLGGTETIKAGKKKSQVLKLSIKCVKDAEFEIHWSDAQGNHVDTFTSVDISDHRATFKLKRK